MRIALGIEYNGAHFSGWQRQLDVLTVQAVVEDALFKISGCKTPITAAGRTDAGVHASQQVVHFDTEISRPLTAWVRGVNSFLPSTVAILWAKPVPDHFHARFSAERRAYRYLLLNHPVRSALFSEQTGWTHYPLDVIAMREAASLLVGEHDFSAFRSSECQAKSPIKTLSHLSIQPLSASAGPGAWLAFEFCANAFLHHMVRNLMGALIAVGSGNRSLVWLKTVLDSRDRNQNAPMFSASGLYLSAVRYPAEFGLPSWPMGEGGERLPW